MPLSPDSIFDRIKLKSQIKKWRVAAILLLMLLLLTLSTKIGSGDYSYIGGDYIARISVKGIIEEDRERDEIIADLAKDKRVKGVILYIDSPGGTLAGGESLFNALRDLAAQKPVVAQMGTLAASAGYLIGTAADHIVALNGTLTGSIGVLLQSVEVTDLAAKLGVGITNIKSSPLKGAPSPLEKTTPEVAEAMQKLIDDAYDYFLSTVAARRNIEKEELRPIADGRVYTGGQALSLKLIDEIGAEKEAVKWLEDKKNLKKNLHVKEVKLEKDDESLQKYITGLAGKAGIIPEEMHLHGMLALFK